MPSSNALGYNEIDESGEAMGLRSPQPRLRDLQSECTRDSASLRRGELHPHEHLSEVLPLEQAKEQIMKIML